MLTVMVIVLRPRRRSLQAGHVPLVCRRELCVEAADQDRLQVCVGDDADRGAGEREQPEQPGDQPAAQRPCCQPLPGSRGAARGNVRRHDQAGGFSTYPTPRTVWISGSRPESTFLRR